jgi:hypothetical protein
VASSPQSRPVSPVAAQLSPLPPDVVLLHIGPYKTGTTALQGAFHTGREVLEAHGAHYAGAGRQPMLAALAMTERPGRRGDPKATERHWRDLVDDVRAARAKRVLVSSEFFSDAKPEVIERVVDGLGGPKVHVIVTLRPLAKIMPSQWQQYVQNGLRKRYDEWLDIMLNQPPYDAVTPSFWNRHSHDRLVERWAKVVGSDRLTVVVLDESDRAMLLNTFEALLGVPLGLMEPENNVANRSLTVGEVEVVRLLNEEFRRRNWPDTLYGRVARTGVAKRMLNRVPKPDEAVITTPQWAAERAAEIGAGMADKITALGVRVIGDLASLGEVPKPKPGIANHDADTVPTVPSSAAATAIIGTVIATRNADEPDPLPVDSDTLEAFASKDLLRVVSRRARRRLQVKIRARVPRSG